MNHDSSLKYMDFYNVPVDVWSPYHSGFKGLLETGTYLCLRVTVQPQHRRLGGAKPVRVVSNGDVPVRGQPWICELAGLCESLASGPQVGHTSVLPG